MQPEPLRPLPSLALEVYTFIGGEMTMLPLALHWYGVDRPEVVESLLYLINVIRRNVA